MRWNPNLYRKEGLSKGYSDLYLRELVRQGYLLNGINMPVIFSLAHLAQLSRTLYSDLHGFVSRADLGRENYPYRNFTIAKRSGGRRWISVPAPQLMAAQQWINENILCNAPAHSAAFAYVPKRRLKDHALQHCGADWVVKLDIKDFFGNISERQVFDVFLSLKFHRLLSFEMARLCTRVAPKRTGSRWNNADANRVGIPEYSCSFVGFLPQGAPTSPALSNLICFEMDGELQALAEQGMAVYTRYADDIYFSFSGGTRQRALEIKREAAKILWKYGFTENQAKSRIIPPGARKIVTGLIANDLKPSIPKEMRDTIKMHLFFAKKCGISAHCQQRKFQSIIGFKNFLLGLIGHVKSVDDRLGKLYLDKFWELPWPEI